MVKNELLGFEMQSEHKLHACPCWFKKNKLVTMVSVSDSLWFPPTIESPHGYQFRVAEMDLNKQNKPVCIYLDFSLMMWSDDSSFISDCVRNYGKNRSVCSCKMHSSHFWPFLTIILFQFIWGKCNFMHFFFFNKGKGVETWGTSGIFLVSEPESLYGHEQTLRKKGKSDC